MSRVEVILDVREFLGPASTRAELQALWAGVEHVLTGYPLQDYPIPWGSYGKVSLTLAVSARGTWTPETPVAIQGVIHRTVPGRVCEVCLESDAENPRYAPFTCRCKPCRDARSSIALCEEHAVIPSGGEGSFHPKHAPRCPRCGAQATFWCDGSCNQAWCNDHGKSHPSSRDHAYCEGCYDDFFPACSVAGCTNLGTLRCEHVTSPTGSASCRRWVCSIHGIRWQVYGDSEKNGLARCTLHANIPSLPQDEILRQILYGTVLRQIRNGDKDHGPAHHPRLPRLRAMNFIYRNAGQSSPNYPELHAAFVRAAASTSDAREGQLLKQRLQQHMPELSKELAQLRGNTTVLRDRLRSLLLDSGLTEVAEAIEIVDYKPAKDANAKDLAFWRLPDPLKGHFIGRGGQTIRSLSDRLGVILKEDERKR
ncbi:MAG: hypothetical protein U0326_10105 [Polyangiales bacterium]